MTLARECTKSKEEEVCWFRAESDEVGIMRSIDSANWNPDAMTMGKSRSKGRRIPFLAVFILLSKGQYVWRHRLPTVYCCITIMTCARPKRTITNSDTRAAPCDDRDNWLARQRTKETKNGQRSHCSPETSNQRHQMLSSICFIIATTCPKTIRNQFCESWCVYQN